MTEIAAQVEAQPQEVVKAWEDHWIELPRLLGGSLGGSCLRIQGPDREKFLHGIVTSTSKGLQAGASRLGLALTAKGRIQGEFLLLSEADGFLLLLPPGSAGVLAEHLERYHIVERVTLGAVKAEERAFALLAGKGIEAWWLQKGGGWGAIGQGLSLPEVWKTSKGSLPPVSLQETSKGSLPPVPLQETSKGSLPPVSLQETSEGSLWPVPLQATRIGALGEVDALVVWGLPSEVEAVTTALSDAGGRLLQGDEIEALRATAGWYDSDSELKGLLVHEAGLEDSHVDFKKGCFVGQEVVARTEYRGKANKGLFLLSCPEGLSLSDDASLVTQDGEEAGKPLRIVTLFDGTKALRALLRLSVAEKGEILFSQPSFSGSHLPLRRLTIRWAFAP